MATDLKTQMLFRLVEQGGWMLRAELEAGLSSSPPAVEDALSDLVIEGKAEYRAGAGYRLAGGVMARRAAWLLRRKRLARAVVGEQVRGDYRVGVAEMQPVGPSGALALVMYELALPMPPDGPKHLEQHMRQIKAVQDFSMRGGECG